MAHVWYYCHKIEKLHKIGSSLKKSVLAIQFHFFSNHKQNVKRQFQFQYLWQPKAKSNSLCEAVRNPPVRGPASNLAWCAAVPCSRRRSTYFSRSRHRHALLSCVHAYILNTSRLFWLSLAIVRNWLSYSIQGLEMNRIFMYYTSSAWPRAWFHQFFIAFFLFLLHSG